MNCIVRPGTRVLRYSRSLLPQTAKRIQEGQRVDQGEESDAYISMAQVSGAIKNIYMLGIHNGPFRIILDEAHNIKERSTNAAKAAFALDGKYKWCLSGTPLQNRVGELYSLIRFLGGDRKCVRDSDLRHH